MVDSISLKRKVGKYYISDKILNQTEFSSTVIGCLSDDITHLVVIKIFDKSNFSEDEITGAIIIFKRTLLFMSLAPYNFVKMLDFIQTKSNFYVVEEFCNGGSLHDYLKKKGGYLSERETLIIFNEIIKACKWMQEKLIIHKGINPKNILIDKGTLKISLSFGKHLASCISKPEIVKIINTEMQNYVAPEILQGEVFSSKLDIWSIGVLSFQLLYGKLPFLPNDDESDQILLTKIMGNKELVLVDFPKKPIRSERFKNLIAKMLIKNDEQRCSWEYIFDSLDKQSREESIKESEYLERNDKLLKAFWVNKFYLEKNRVINQIREFPEEYQEPKSLNKKEENNEEQETKQLDERKKNKYAKRMDDYLIFERNIAMFYNNLAVQLLKSYESKRFDEISIDLYYRFLYWVSKYSNLAIFKVAEALVKKTEIVSNDKYNVWDYYTKSSFYCSTKKIIDRDIENIEYFYRETTKKVEEEIAKFIKTDKNPYVTKVNTKFLEKMGKVEKSEGVLLEIKELEKEIPISFNNFLEGFKKENLVLVRHMHVAAHPYRFFRWNQKMWFSENDFEKFYEEIENEEEGVLRVEIKEFWEKNLLAKNNK